MPVSVLAVLVADVIFVVSVVVAVLCLTLL